MESRVFDFATYLPDDDKPPSLYTSTAHIDKGKDCVFARIKKKLKEQTSMLSKHQRRHCERTYGHDGAEDSVEEEITSGDLDENGDEHVEIEETAGDISDDEETIADDEPLECSMNISVKSDDDSDEEKCDDESVADVAEPDEELLRDATFTFKDQTLRDRLLRYMDALPDISFGDPTELGCFAI